MYDSSLRGHRTGAFKRRKLVRFQTVSVQIRTYDQGWI